MIECLHISDCHLHADQERREYRVSPAARLQRVTSALVKRHPAARFVVITGDLTDAGSPRAYRLLEQILSPLRCPVHVLPGNHDQRHHMATQLTGRPARMVAEVQVGTWRILLLDSTLANHCHGLMPPERLEHLEQMLAEHPHRHTLVCLHHPPVAIGTPWMDQIGLRNPDALFAVLDRHPQVRGLLFGHLHQPFNGLRRGIPLLGTPATAVQFVPGTAQIEISHAPPAYRHLRLLDDGTILSKIRSVQAKR